MPLDGILVFLHIPYVSVTDWVISFDSACLLVVIFQAVHAPFKPRWKGQCKSTSYDAIYRPVSASGREHLGQTNGRPVAPVAPDGSHGTHNATGNDAGDGNSIGLDKETYRYDVAGNLLSMRHEGRDAQNPG